MNNIKIFIATHKEYKFPTMEDYCPIYLGKSGENRINSDLTDNLGDNISELNPYFNEITALYWMWKNAKEDILGLVHYRRYFVDIEDNAINIISAEKFNKIISYNPNTVILANPVGNPNVSNEQIWNKYHMEIDWLKLQDIITHSHREYLDSFIHIEKHYMLSYMNMFVAHRTFVDKYCKWLFSILFELHNRIDYSDHDDYQKRAIGIISERLLNVFIHKHRDILDVQYAHVYLVEDKKLVL